MMAANRLKPSALQFSAFICHDTGRRCPHDQTRIFKFEATTDSSRYPLGWVVCPESGNPGNYSPEVDRFCREVLPTLEAKSHPERLQAVRDLIQRDAANWQIGEGENLAETRKGRCLGDSSADFKYHPNGTVSLIMDYVEDLKGTPAARFPALCINA